MVPAAVPAPTPKRRKVEEAGYEVTASPASQKAKDIEAARVTEAQRTGFNLKVQEARDFAVRQAQQDGCTGNYRIFDSPYGNFMLPVVPSRADLLK